MDTELFDLCKEVYKRFPQWDDTQFLYYKRDDDARGWHLIGNADKCIDYKNMSSGFTLDSKDHIVSLYTSDYLLEKLEKHKLWVALELHKVVHRWVAYKDFVDEYDEKVRTISGDYADTPLKALLKLVIALDDAKELTS